MSDKNSESFEEWWEMFELHCVTSDETFKVIEIVESAWNHQQKKIDELEFELTTSLEQKEMVEIRAGQLIQKLQAAEEREKILREIIRKMSLRSDVGYSTAESNLIDEIKGIQPWNN